MAVAISIMMVPGSLAGAAVASPVTLTASTNSVAVTIGDLLATQPTAAPAAASNLSVTLANTGADANVKVVVEADDVTRAHVQAWFVDSLGNWCNTMVDGFGPVGGFALPAGYSATTDFYLLADQAGSYNATLKVVDLATDEVLSQTAIGCQAGTVALAPSAGSVKVSTGDLVATRPTAAPAAASNLSVTLANTGAATNVKVVVEADDATRAHVQAWFVDSLGNWCNTMVDGFGPVGGFALPAGYSATTDFYVMADQVGSYNATLKVVDLATEKVLSEVPIVCNAGTVSLGASANSVNVLTRGLLDGRPVVAPAAAANLSVTLANAGADRSVKVVVEASDAARSDVQVWFVDSLGTWCNVMVDGFGPDSGFPVPAGYSATTDFYVIANQAGSYSATLKVVDVATGAVLSQSVIDLSARKIVLTYSATEGGTIKGAAAQAVDFSASGTPVTAVPTLGYRFVSWSDGVTTATRTDVNVTGDKSVTATFAKNPTPTLYNVRVPSTTLSRSKYYTVSTFLKPRHKSGTYPVRIYKQRLVNGKWTSYGYVNAKATNYSSYTKCAKSIRLPNRGRWRLRAYAPSDAQHYAKWSSKWTYVTVK